MKDKLITEIMTGMATMLTLEQLEELQRVITHSFYNVEIIERKPSNSQGSTGNSDLLDVFIAAKRI